MKKQFLLLTLWLASVVGLMAQTATAPAVGDGTSGNPYQIATLNNLYWLSDAANIAEWGNGKYFIQTADIDASTTSTWDGGKGFLPIGNVDNNFRGQYDGQDFTITNLTINRPLEDYVGLFGVGSASGGTGGRIDNVGIIDANIIGKGFVGALIGKSSWIFEISNCYAANVTITGSEDYVGGLLGTNHSAFVNYCWTSGTVSGRDRVGGLAGFHRSKGIDNNYSSAVVNGSDNVGGLIGRIDAGGNITDCYSVGKVNGTSNTGGLIGSTAASVTTSYYNSETSGQTGVGTPKTSTELMQTATFVGWDFASTWTIVDTETTPYLTSIPNAAIALAADQIAPADVEYTQTVKVASMGNATSSLELTAGPTGMTLTAGVISWTPTQAGTETATIKITGSNGLIGSSSFSITTLPFNGEGTADSPFEIATLDHLKELSETSSYWDLHFIQTADIDASSTVDWDDGDGFTPIGNSGTKFTGSYSGKGFTITGLTISRKSASPNDYMGLFGYANGATIDSVGLLSSYTSADRYTGALVGYCLASTVSNCYAYNVTSDVGYYSGGFIGYGKNSTISNCWVSGESTSSARNHGGFIGYHTTGGTISNCYANVYMGGTQYGTGGFVGSNNGSAPTITNCYSLGHIVKTGTSGVGGFGTGADDAMFNCYYNSETSGKSDDSGRGHPRTTAEMQQDSTFSEMQADSSFIDFDFTDTWSIVNGEDYPSLKSVPNAAVLSPINNAVAVVGTPYTETVSVLAMGNQNITLELIKNPEGMTISTEGVISWTPTQKGNDTIIVKVTDAAGFISIADYTIVTVTFGGTGTMDNPFTIATLGQLKELAETPLVWDKYYLQTANIDAMATHTWDSIDHDNDTLTADMPQGFSPIGNSDINFTGSYNGGGFSITNLYIYRASDDYVGLFGYASGTAIDKLAISSCSITGKSYVGAIAGRMDGDSVSNSYASGSVAGYSYIGGLIGRNSGASIANCYSSASVNGSLTVGGLIGRNYSESSVTNCYATGPVSAYSSTGGLLGTNAVDSIIISSYYNYESAGQSDTVTLKGEAKTIADMKLQATFVDWDFTNTWDITAGTTFPRLKSVVDGPIIVLPATTTILVNTEYKEGIHIIGMDDQDITYEILQKPEAMVVSNDTLVYTPMQTGTDTVVITATDGAGLTATQVYYLNAMNNFIGNGSDSIPYEIATLDELKALSEAPYLWDKFFIQTADIDALETNTWDSAVVVLNDSVSIDVAQGFSPIGSNSSWFTGSYNAQGYSISNLYINREATSYVGLFGYIRGGAIDSSLAIINCDITGSSYVGGIAGYNSSNELSGCSVTGTVSGGSNTGGLVGYNSSSPLTNCYAIATVSGGGYTGGLVGYNSSSAVTDCYTKVTLSGQGNTGGLLGYNSGSTVTNCSAAGAVSGSGSYTGGLIGSNASSLENCNSSCSVSGGFYVGGLVGTVTSSSAKIANSYATGDVSGILSGYANVGGFVGSNSGFIDYCYATGAVTGVGRYTGGFVGTNRETINNSYATGSVSGESSVGGFAGYNYFGDIYTSYSIGVVNASTTSNIGGFLGETYAWWTIVANSYYNSELSGQSDNLANKGEPKTSVEMKDALTFAYWDFEGTWTVTANTFPTLDTLNNAPFAFADTLVVTGNASVLLNDYDYETGQSALVAKMISESSKGSFIGNNYSFNNGIEVGTMDTIVYRVGELIAEGDILWGSRAVAIFTQIENTAPVLTAVVDKTTNEETPITLTMADVTASDADGDKLYLSISTGANFSMVSSTVIPDADFYGDLTVGIQVTDGNMKSNQMNMTITVIPVPDPTEITWAAPDMVLYGTAIGEAAMNATTISVGTFSYNFKADSVFNVGSHELVATFTPTEANDYMAATDTVIYVVEQAMLTATAEDKSMLEGEAVPELTIVYDGFVNNEDASVLDVAPTATTNATPSSSADTYRINVSGGSDMNYDFTYVFGELTIIERVLGVSATELAMAAMENSTETFDITSNIDWTVTSSESWLTADQASGVNDATITLTAEANNTDADRMATITLAGEGVDAVTVTVTQSAIAALSVSVTEIAIDSTGVNTATFDITSNISWTVTSSESWLTADPISGENDATVTLTAEANNTTENRSATITVAGEGVDDQMITVTQSFTIGLNDVSLSAITVYPNPANIAINLTNVANTTVEIMNVTGRVVFTKELVSDMEQINVSNFDAGIYIITITNDKGAVSKRLIIE